MCVCVFHLCSQTYPIMVVITSAAALACFQIHNLAFNHPDVKSVTAAAAATSPSAGLCMAADASAYVSCVLQLGQERPFLVHS